MRRKVRLGFAHAVAGKADPGTYGRALVKIEAQLAKDAVVARAESLLRAHQQARMPFDETAFQSTLKDIRRHLDRYSRVAYRMVIKEVCWKQNQSDEDLRQTIARLIQRSIERIFDDVFEMLVTKRVESLMEIRACQDDVA
jgi:hypothetical protein